MNSIVIAGLDPALSNLGMSKGCLDLDTGILSDIQIELIQTASVKSKQIRKNSDDLERARVLYKAMQEFLKGVDIVCVEIPVGSQSARAMCSYGVCIALLASIQIPLVQVTPTEVKLATGLSKTASKAQMIEWAVKQYPSLLWLKRTTKGTSALVSKNEHIADSLAAIYAGVNTDQFKLIRINHARN